VEEFMTEKIEVVEKELETKALTIKEVAERPVTDQASYNLATDVLKQVKGLLKEIDDTFGPIVSAAHAVHKEALAKKAKYEEPLKKMESSLRARAQVWVQEQDRIRKEAEREAERERAEKEAEERKKQQQEAEALRSTGDEKAAKQVEAVNIVVVASGAAPRIDQNGVASRDVWKYEITDVEKLPREFLIPDERKIGEFVRTFKGEAAEVLGEGVRVYSEKSLIVR
jgi:uncharacterized protein with von Willebrand factor type A (vWA) domain